MRCEITASSALSRCQKNDYMYSAAYVLKRDSATDIARSILEGRPRYMLVSHPPGCLGLMVSVDTVDSTAVISQRTCAQGLFMRIISYL